MQGKKIEWPVEDMKRWIEVEGKTHQWIGNELKCNHKHISAVCKRYGIQSQRRGPRGEAGHPNWKGGRIIDKDGYALLWVKDHPYGRSFHKGEYGGKYVLEHRLVMECKLCRYLHPKEVVHHVNKDKQDNRIENLGLFSKNSEHLRHELTGKIPKWSDEGRQRTLDGGKKYWSQIRKNQQKDA